MLILKKLFLAPDGDGKGGSDGQGDKGKEGEGGSGRKDGDTELDKVIKQRDELKAAQDKKDLEINGFKTQLDELNKKLSETDKSKAISEKDVEALRGSFQKDVDAVQKKLDDALKEKDEKASKLSEVIVERDVMTSLRKVVRDPSVVYMLLKDEIEVHEENGIPKARAKSSNLPIAEFVEKRLEELDKGYLLLNDRKKGTDGKPTKQTPAGTTTKDTLLKMTSTERKIHFAKNPEDRKLITG